MSQSYEDCADVYDERIGRSRKDRRCDACGEVISSRQRYCRIRQLCAGHWEGWVRCMRCQRMHEHLRVLCRSEGWGYQWPDERLDCGHEYFEMWSREPPQEVASLAFAGPQSNPEMYEKL
jgi:hypothetical protein